MTELPDLDAPKCMARESNEVFFRACYPCQLPHGHEGKHSARDGEWEPPGSYWNPRETKLTLIPGGKP